VGSSSSFTSCQASVSCSKISVRPQAGLELESPASGQPMSGASSSLLVVPGRGSTRLQNQYIAQGNSRCCCSGHPSIGILIRRAVLDFEELPKLLVWPHPRTQTNTCFTRCAYYHPWTRFHPRSRERRERLERLGERENDKRHGWKKE
jgi:hypothetical protein